jgi:YjbE family integral membrane protein
MLNDVFAGLGEQALPILKIIWIDLVLSGDNAVLIALACRNLPERQRKWGIALGAAVAILMRIAFAGVVTQLMAVPWLKVVAGLMLFAIAVKLLMGEDEGEANVKASDRLFAAVMTIAIADATMSLDNVMAVAAVAEGSLGLIAFGVALSIPLIVFGSSLILSLINRFPVIIWAGAALLGWVAGELIAREHELHSALLAVGQATGLGEHGVHLALAALGAVSVVGVGWLLRRGKAPAHSA